MSDYDAVDVLLVEDNDQDADLIFLALKKCHIHNKVYWAKDGLEALDFIRCRGIFERRNPLELPRLILLDLTMPRVSGLEVLRALKADVRTHAIPVVVMSISNQDRDLEHCYELGVNGFVTKPVGFPELTEAVARIGMYWLTVNRVG